MQIITTDTHVITADINSDRTISYSVYELSKQGTFTADVVANNYSELITTALVVAGVITSEELLFADIQDV